MKFGGTSLGDITRIKSAAIKIKREISNGMSVVVVVSAMGNTTDALISLAKAISPNPTRRELDLLISSCWG